MTSPATVTKLNMPLADFLHELRLGYTVHRVGDSAWRVDDPDGNKVAFGCASTIADWALKISRGRAQIRVIVEAVAVFANSSRPLERLEPAVARLVELGVDPYDSVDEEGAL